MDKEEIIKEMEKCENCSKYYPFNLMDCYRYRMMKNKLQ